MSQYHSVQLGTFKDGGKRALDNKEKPPNFKNTQPSKPIYVTEEGTYLLRIVWLRSRQCRAA